MMTNNSDDSGADALGQYIGSYRLLRLLGRGGFASVYLGEHRYLKRLAAIKVLRTLLNDKDKERFLKEARLLANLSHPHIVQVHEFEVPQRVNGSGGGKFTEYIPYLVMDFAPGGSLRALYPAGSCLFVDVAVGYVKQLATALQYAHDNGVIHRDVKPENCLLNEQQEVMLSDFGLALFAPTPGLLSTQQMAGTLPYAAPEQLRGKPEFASDQYSLGIMAYEWLCGHRPFEGEEVEIIMQHLSSPPPSLSSRNPAVSAAVEAVVLKALEKNPQRRYSSVQEFASALEHASQQNTADSSSSSSPGQRRKNLTPKLVSPNFEVEPTYFREIKGRQAGEDIDALPVELEQATKLKRAQRQLQISQPLPPTRKKKRTLLIMAIIVFMLILGSSGVFYLKTGATLPALPAKASPGVAKPSAEVLPPLSGAINFTVEPPSVSGMTMVTNKAKFQGDHSELGASQPVIADFFLSNSPGSEQSKLVSVFVSALVGRSGNNDGSAPLSLYCNGQSFVTDFIFPGHGFQPDETSFQIPPGQLVYGKNEIKIVVSSHALGEFWLYRMGISMGLPTAPALANFTTRPASIHGMTLVSDETTFESNHSALGAGQQLVVDFVLPGSPGPGKSKRVSIFINALVERSGSNRGYAPISLYSNGQALVQNFTIPGDGLQPSEPCFQIPPGQLVYGKNEIKLLVSNGARSEAWIYSIGIMPGIPY